jgi:hypothetical protein
MKYAEEPMKFLDNEVDLMSLVRGLAQVRVYVIKFSSSAAGLAAGLAAAT